MGPEVVLTAERRSTGFFTRGRRLPLRGSTSRLWLNWVRVVAAHQGQPEGADGSRQHQDGGGEAGHMPGGSANIGTSTDKESEDEGSGEIAFFHDVSSNITSS